MLHVLSQVCQRLLNMLRRNRRLLKWICILLPSCGRRLIHKFSLEVFPIKPKIWNWFLDSQFHRLYFHNARQDYNYSRKLLHFTFVTQLFWGKQRGITIGTYDRNWSNFLGCCNHVLVNVRGCCHIYDDLHVLWYAHA